MKTLHTIFTNFATKNMARLRLLLVLFLTLTVTTNAWGAEGDEHTFTSDVKFEKLLNNSAAINDVTISDPGYPVKKIIVNCRYNKTAGGVTISVKIGGETFASSKTHNSNSTVDIEFTDEAMQGDIVFSFVNNCSDGTGKGTFYFNSVTLVEGLPADPCTVTLMDDTDNPLTQSSPGEILTLPERDGCEGYAFAGWTNSWTVNQTTWTTTAPEIIAAGEYTPTEDVNLYPVYTKTEGGGAEPTAYSEGDVGSFVIVSYNTSNSKWYAIPQNPTLSSGKITGVEIAVSETTGGVKYVSTANAEGYTWTIANATNGQTLSDGSKYIYHSNGGSSGTNLAYGNSTSYTWKIASESKGLTFQAMNGSATYARGLLFNGTFFGGYALSNEDNSGYYRIQVLPISSGSTTSYISVPDCIIETTISLNPNGGEISDENWTLENGVYELTTEENSIQLPSISRKGYTFVEWASANGNVVYSNNAKINDLKGSPIILYAKWTAKQTKITLAYQDGSGNTEQVTATYDQPMPEITIPTREGYNFQGYFTANGGTSTHYYNADGTSAKNWDKEDENFTLIAYWTAKQLTNYRTFCEAVITLDPNTGIFTETPAGWAVNSDGTYSKTVNQNQATSLPTPEKTNYVFAGWETDGVIYTDTYTPTTDDVTFTAQWNCTPPTSVEITSTNENGWRYSLGETISLKATATGGSGNYTYQWQKYIENAWKDIEGATSDTYSIANCTSGDGGSYRCVVSTGDECSSYESDGYFVRVFTLNGAYFGEEWAENTINWSSATQGTVTLHLEASRTYLFKVTDNNGKWFGSGKYGNDYNYIVQPWQQDCGTDNDDIRLFTGPEGDYTFTIDIEKASDDQPTVNISVAYPDVEHPVVGYGYITKWWEECYIHWWETKDNPLTQWGNDANITTSTTICGTDYYYFPIIDNYANLIIKDKIGDPNNTTGDQTQDGHSGWYITHDGSNWVWNEFAEYAITFNSNGGNGTIDPIEEICPNTDITLPINTLTKEGYTFKGWTADVAVNVNGTNVPAGNIIADGATIKNITSNITLTAQWFQKIATTLQWSSDTYTAALEADNTFPVLTITPETSTEAVKYASTNESVATIDENGNITLVGVGSTTIKASITADDTYLSASDSYTLTVVEANCKWVETEIDDIDSNDEVVVMMVIGEIGYALSSEKIVNSPKSKQITITSGIIDDNQNLEGYVWNITSTQEGYILQANGKTNTYLYGVKSYISIGETATPFIIYESPDNGNKCFAYVASNAAYFIGLGTESGETAWKRFETSSLLSNSTLKFYKKTCLVSDVYWIDYNLANAVCANTPPYSQITKEGGNLSLKFNAEEGYVLPENVSVTNAEYTWDKEEGTLILFNPTDNVTITITAIKRHTVNWMVGNNSVLTEYVLNNKAIQNTPSDPADNDLGYCATKFMGWSETELGSDAGQSAPDDLCSAAEMKANNTSLTEDKTFYAVYASQKDDVETEVVLSFESTDQRTSYSTEKQVWEQNGITLINKKGTGNNIGDYSAPARFYKNSSITIEYTSPIYKIVFDCNGDTEDEHITNLVSSIGEDNVTVNRVDELVSVEFNESVESYTVTLTEGQVRLDKLTIYPVVYSNYLTQCAELPTPTYAGPTIDKHELKVKCGERSSMNSAATITFDPTTNYDLSLPITLTASEGFLLSTNKTKNDAYTTSVTVNPVKSGDNKGKITQNVYIRAEASADTKDDYNGTITIEGAQVGIKTIDVTAIVTCNPHTITFYSYNAKTKAKYYVGEEVQEPETPASPCEGYVFDGWSASIVEEGATTYSKVTFPYEMPNRNTILYAVYRIEGGTYAKVSEALEDYSGEYLIVYEDGNVAFNGGLSTLDAASNTISVDITDNTITSETTTDDANFTFAKVEGGYSIKSASGIYIGRKTDDNDIDESESIVYVNTISINDEGNADIVGTGGAYLRYNANSNQNRFRYYKSSNYTAQKAIALYKKENSFTSYPDCTPPVEPEKPQALPATFSVSTTEKVQFSAGNLQYHTGEQVWRFAPEQYDVVGQPNTNIGNPNFKDWVDMFGWSADGKFGVNPSNDQDDYNKDFVDWGKVFSEEKYGVSGDEWYTLTMGEWYYLLNTRTNASSLKQVAIVGEMIGVLLFPDNWVMPASVTTSLQTDADGVEYYPYTLDQWKQLEAAGAVFLPAAGRRTGGWGNKTVSPHIEDKENPDNFDSEGYYRWQDNTNYYGYYWTSTKDSDDKTYFLITCKMSDDGETGNPSLPSLWKEDGRYGQSVRLVRKCAQLQVVEWKENSIVIMYNGDPAQTATVTINNEQKGIATLSEVNKDIAVYEIPAEGLASVANQQMEIAIGSAKALMTIPYIATGNATNAPANSDLVILKDATYTANGEQLRNVTVYGGGKLVVDNGASLSTSTLTLRIGGVKDGNYDYVYPEFVLNGTWSNAVDFINLDYLTTKAQYYTFVAPFAVQTKDIQYPVEFYGNNVAADNRGSFEFQYYDGEARATGATGWKTVEENPTNGATLTQGIGYTFLGMPKKVKVNGGTSTRQKFGIHRIPMNVTSEEAVEHESEEQSVKLSVHLADKNNDSGWNLIGNPYMATITGLTNDAIQVGKLVQSNGTWHWDTSVEENNQRFLVIPSNDGQSFESVQASNATLPAFKNFFVQIGNKDANALTIPNTRVDQSLAPARRAAEEAEGDIELAIVLEQEGARADQMDFLINTAYSAAFDYNADFTKMMNATKLNLYGVHTDDNLSFVALDNHAAQQAVAIGYQVPAAGEYTLRMSDKAYVMWERIEALYLTDHEAKPEVTTDIMMNPYVFHVANAETNNTRFTISIRLRENSGITTDLENRHLDTQQPYKFCYQDKLYIICNGVIYDATGKQVRVMNK